MKKLIIANFKMNFAQEQLTNYFKKLFSYNMPNNSEVVVMPSFTELALAKKHLAGKSVLLGAQDVSDKEQGAYTGQVSAKMLKELGVSYVLVGHSEKRKYFLEKNKTINQKIKTLLKYGLKPVLCVGETEKELKQNKTNQVLKTQVEQAFTGLYENELSSITIAYEPVWAIGTKKHAGAKHALQAAKQIRQVVKHIYSQQAAENIKILYGGSLNSSNAKTYLEHKQINGALVGSASLDAEEFFKIIADR